MNPIQSTDSLAYVAVMLKLTQAVDSLEFTEIKTQYRNKIEQYNYMADPKNKPAMFQIEDSIQEINKLQQMLPEQMAMCATKVENTRKLARVSYDPLCQSAETCNLGNKALVQVLGIIDDKEASMKKALSEFEQQLKVIVVQQINELAKTIYWFTSIADGDVRSEVIERLKTRTVLLSRCTSEKTKLEDLNDQARKLKALETQVLEKRNQKQQELNNFLSKCQNAITILQTSNSSEIEKLNQQFTSAEKIEIHQAYCRLHKEEFQPTLTRFLFSSQFNVDQLIQSLQRIMRLKKQAETCIIQKDILNSTDALSEILTKNLVQYILSFVQLPKTAQVCKSWNEMTDKTFFQTTFSFLTKDLKEETWKEIIGRLLTDHPEIQTYRQLLIVLNNWACDWIEFLCDAHCQMIPANYRIHELITRREFIQIAKIIFALHWYRGLSSMHHMDLQKYYSHGGLMKDHLLIIQSIVPQVKIFRNLTDVHFNHPECKVIADEFYQFKNLQKLVLRVQTISEEVFDLTNLQELDIRNSNVPLQKLTNLTNLIDLRLQKCELTEVPMEVLNLTKLQTLALLSNQITKIPQEIVTFLTNLQMLDLEENPFTEIPDFFDSPEFNHPDFYFSSEFLKKIPSEFFFSTESRKTHFVINIFMNLAKFKFLNQDLETKEIFNHLPIEIQNKFPGDWTYEFPLLYAFAYFHHFIAFDDLDILFFDRSLELLPEEIIDEYKSFENEHDVSDIDTIENFIQASQERKKAFESMKQFFRKHNFWSSLLNERVQVNFS